MPVIPQLVLTNQLPINTYSASMVTSASLVADGLGNQLNYLDVMSTRTPDYLSISPSVGTITINFNTASDQAININSAGTYTFATSNLPSSGKVSDVILYFSHSAVSPSTLNYPANWVNVNGGWPVTINATTIGVFWIRCIGSSYFVGTYGSN